MYERDRARRREGYFWQYYGLYQEVLSLVGVEVEDAWACPQHTDSQALWCFPIIARAECMLCQILCIGVSIVCVCVRAVTHERENWMTVFHSLAYIFLLFITHVCPGLVSQWYSFIFCGCLLPGYVDSITYVKYNMLYATSCHLGTFAFKILFHVSISMFCVVGMERDELCLCIRHLCRPTCR